jgi:shikimate dehydrogenase
MWAEVIGDPVAYSKSPAIHGFWLAALGLDADYRATRVGSDGLAGLFAERRSDPDWRGCNVTAPHKRAILPFLDRLSATAGRIGAVNCVVREGQALIGHNTDVEGIGEALAGADLRKVVLIGAGGGARAALDWLSGKHAGAIIVLARDPQKASRELGFEDVRPLAGEMPAGVTLVVNASPLGMAHAGPMPPSLLETLPAGATALDMVYHPLDTQFLQAARARGLETVDGLAMLIGQAREAFRLFFGAEAPSDRDAALRAALLDN